MTMDDLSLYAVVVCTSHQTDSEDELVELINASRQVSRPEGLYNEDVYISEGDIDEYTIMYSSGETEHPDRPSERTVLSSDILNGERFHVHSTMHTDYYERVITTHEQMLSKAGEIDVGYITVALHLDADLESVLENVNVVNVNGDINQIEAVNFINKGLDLTFANFPVETLITSINRDIGPIEASAIEGEVNSVVEESKRVVSELTS